MAPLLALLLTTVLAHPHAHEAPDRRQAGQADAFFSALGAAPTACPDSLSGTDSSFFCATTERAAPAFRSVVDATAADLRPVGPWASYTGEDDQQRSYQLAFDARRAWTEYVPARVMLDEDADDPRQFLKIQRSFSFGRLAELFMTDERSYRDGPPCGDADAGERYATPGCLEQSDPSRSMLGNAQRQWLTRGLTRSKAQWKVWGNEVFQGPLRLTPTEALTLYVNLDAWDGFLAERKRIMQELKSAGIQNLVVLTGDLHTYIASYLKVDYDADPLNLDPRNLVGVEFMTPAVTSANLAELLANGGGPIGEAAQQFGLTDVNALEPLIRATNPHIQFFNSSEWGYSTVEFTRTYCEYTAYSVDKSQPQGAPSKVIRRLRVPSGRVQLQERPLSDAGGEVLADEVESAEVAV